MEFDYKNPPKDCCPNVLCGQRKEDCCWVTKVVIAAVLGDDSDTSPVKPKDGAYTNKIVEYEANGAIYFYSSDGLWTKLGNKLPSAETASVAYVNSQDASVLRAAVSISHEDVLSMASAVTDYVDRKDATNLQAAKDYADGKATATLNAAELYTDNKTTSILPDAKAYADAQDAITLQAAKDYTDSAASSVVTRGYVDTGDANTLETAKAYADQEVGTLEDSLATVATTGSYNDLTNTPDVPVFTLTTTDPGEGAALADNHFIGVYS